MGFKNFISLQKKSFGSIFGGGNETNTVTKFNDFIINYNLLSFDNKLKVFATNPTLMAGMSKMSRLFSSGYFEVVDAKQKQVANDPLSNLINNPNFFQSKEEYLTQWLILTILDGGSITLPMTPTGFDKRIDYADAIMNVPMSSASMDYVNFKNYQSYKDSVYSSNVNLYVNGCYTNVKYSELIPMYDIGLNPNNDDLLCPFSRLSSLKWSLSNIQTANESANVMADNPAGLGLISTGSKVAGEQIPMNEKEKEALDKQLEGHGTTHSKRKFMTSTATLNFQSTLTKFSDLGLKEIKEGGDLDVIRVLDIPKELFSIDGSKYENHKVVELAWIQGSIQSLGDNLANNLNDYFGYGLDKNGKYLRIRYDHLPCFSAKRKETAETLDITAKALQTSLAAELMTQEEAIKIMKDLTGISYE